MRPKKVILLVDDNEQALSVRKFLLETHGYRAVCALTAGEALKRFREGGIDFVICDLLMPELNGNELARQMKTINPEVPTLLVSGAVRQMNTEIHADAFLPKGTPPRELLDRVRTMVARKPGPRVKAVPPQSSARPVTKEAIPA